MIKKIQKNLYYSAPLLLAVFVASTACGPSDPYAAAVPVVNAKPGDLVRVVGTVEAEPVGDAVFFQYGMFLSWDRRVEVYAFGVGESADGSCPLGWTAEPNLQVGELPNCVGKRNRRSFVPNRGGRAAPRLRAGGAVYELGEGWKLVDMPVVKIRRDDLVPNQPLHEGDDFFVFNKYCLEAPVEDCERIRFTVYGYDPKAEYEVVGRLAEGNRIEAYTESGESGATMFRIRPVADGE